MNRFLSICVYNMWHTVYFLWGSWTNDPEQVSRDITTGSTWHDSFSPLFGFVQDNQKGMGSSWRQRQMKKINEMMENVRTSSSLQRDKLIGFSAVCDNWTYFVPFRWFPSKLKYIPMNQSLLSRQGETWQRYRRCYKEWQNRLRERVKSCLSWLLNWI